MGERRIFIGDIQGCASELDDLLDAVSFRPGRDRLYSVGDAVNRGPDSPAAVRRLRELDATMVLGNHEFNYFTRLRESAGAKDLLAGSDRDELVEWLEARPLVHVEKDIMMVHAAWHPAWTDVPSQARVLNRELRKRLRRGKRLHTASLSFVASARYCDPQGERPKSDWPEPPAPFRPWDSYYAGKRTIVFGHWARRGLVRRKRVRGLDTGCVYGGKLTAWIAEEDRIVQVDARQTWCEV